ncbi:MAG: antibiotic biosynthesis monooxygenase [Planctomycetaceae bacterium]|nr:antibiotic biosynthesis monooxygenase [Planctomycetaceae bacterium]
MITVVASIELKPNAKSQFLKHFLEIVPAVHQEVGCQEYYPAIDVDSGISSQSKNEDSVTILEKWDSLEALRDHLVAPHMTAYRDKIQDLVISVSLKILQPVTAS